MQKFAFIIHPITVRDVARKYPIAKFIPDKILEWYIKGRDPIVTASVTGIRSNTGEQAEGWFIGCPYVPEQFLSLPVEEVYDKLEKCGRLAEEMGAGIVGLGAFTSVVGDGGVTLAKRLKIAVTTGNSYTVHTAIEGAETANSLLGRNINDCTVAIVGATGSIGATCAEILQKRAGGVNLVGRSPEKLEALAARCSGNGRPSAQVFTDVAKGLKDADVIICVSSAKDAIVLPQHIKSGAVVCDVARPRDVSLAVQAERDDVLVIEGGVVRVPGEMRSYKYGTQSPFSFGFPQGTAYACMSETIALSLENRYESFTLGKDVSVSQVEEIGSICKKHGFRLDGFRSFEKAVTEDTIRHVRERAGLHEPTNLGAASGNLVSSPSST